MLRRGTRPWVLWAQTIHLYVSFPGSSNPCSLGLQRGPSALPGIRTGHSSPSLHSIPAGSERSPALHGKNKVSKNIWKGAWGIKAFKCPWKVLLAFFLQSSSVVLALVQQIFEFIHNLKKMHHKQPKIQVILEFTFSPWVRISVRFKGKAAVGFQREPDIQGCFASTWCRESWYLSKSAVEISFPWQVIHNWGTPGNGC